MYTAPFRYLRATSLADAESLFAKTPDAKYIAGGQTLIPTMKQRLAAPAALIDLSRIAALSFIRREKRDARDRRGHASRRCRRVVRSARSAAGARASREA